MKLQYMKEIANTCCEFMEQVITFGESRATNVLMARIEDVCNNYTTHDDDTIDIDYKDMCFTVHKNENGLWELCENASYYIFKNGFLDVVDGVIDVELN